MKLRIDCPGCHERRLSQPFLLLQQPVVLSYRFADVRSAMRVPRRDISLVQCSLCDLVFNASFDPTAIPYDAAYETRNCFSEAYIKHLKTLAKKLTKKLPLSGGRILELGCGKGDFLRMLCAISGARAEGYDTSYEGQERETNILFHRRYVGVADIRQPFDLIICRHVVEHIPEIGVFLKELSAIARAAGDPMIVIETPRLEWIIQNRCIWDVFYEHCNYFTMGALGHLCRKAGFRVIRQTDVFHGQYQILELRLAKTNRRVDRPQRNPNDRIAPFVRAAFQRLRRVERQIGKISPKGRWAIWGAGAKGVGLVNQLQGVVPTCVIDSNVSKQGCVIPGSSVPVVSPQDARVLGLELILIANPNYAEEISLALKLIGYRGQLKILQ